MNSCIYLTWLSVVYLLFFVISASCVAAESSWQIKGQIGLGDQKVEELEYLPESAQRFGDSHLTVEISLSAAYQFSSGYYAEFGVLNNEETPLIYDFENGYQRREAFWYLGYTLNSDGAFMLAPKLGISYWQLDGEFPSEGYDKRFTGIDPLVALDLSFSIGRWTNYVFSVKYGDYDFGYDVRLVTGVALKF